MTYEHKTYAKQYYMKNRNVFLERAKTYYKVNRDSIKKKTAQYALDNKISNAKTRKERRYKLMKSIFDALGNKCELCPETNKVVLQIDHIQGNGRKHLLSVQKSFYRYYGSINESVQSKEGKYRLLCSNCNLSEAVRLGYRKSVWSDEFFNNLLKK